MSLFFFDRKLIIKMRNTAFLQVNTVYWILRSLKLNTCSIESKLRRWTHFLKGSNFFWAQKTKLRKKKQKDTSQWAPMSEPEEINQWYWANLPKKDGLCDELNNRSFFSPIVHLKWVNLSIFKGLRSLGEKKTGANTVFLNKSVFHLCIIESTSSKLLPGNWGKTHNRTLNFRGKCVCD